MAFLEESTWRGKVYSGGWKTAAGGEAPVTEPATGAELGRTGIAGPPDVAAKLAADTEYGLSLGILTGDVTRGLDLARRIPTGIVHINDQTVDDAPNTPFGGISPRAPAPASAARPTWTRSPTPAG
jgi:hypothetical protein